MSMNAAAADAFILFELAGASYAVRSADVLQLLMVEAVTPVPDAPPFVRGVVSVRGNVIPVVDLRARFGFGAAEVGNRSRLLIVRHAARTVALQVDSAREFLRIPPETVEPPPHTVAGLSGRYLEGIARMGERLVMVLSIPELLDARFDIEIGDDDVKTHDQEKHP